MKKGTGPGKGTLGCRVSSQAGASQPLEGSQPRCRPAAGEASASCRQWVEEPTLQERGDGGVWTRLGSPTPSEGWTLGLGLVAAGSSAILGADGN